jgi:hypothetical protein
MANFSPLFNDQKSILAIIDQIVSRLEHYGVSFKRYSSYSINTFMRLPVSVQQDIWVSLLEYYDLLCSIDPVLSKEGFERGMLRSFAEYNQFRFPEEFLSKVRSNDICEIYDLKAQTQIYRNLEFLRHSSYDLLTVCITPYTVLFYREARYAQLIVDRSEYVAKNEKSVVPWNIEDHILVERLDQRNHTFMMRMGYITPVLSAVTGERVAWASTLQVELIGSTLDCSPNVVSI